MRQYRELVFNGLALVYVVLFIMCGGFFTVVRGGATMDVFLFFRVRVTMSVVLLLWLDWRLRCASVAPVCFDRFD